MYLIIDIETNGLPKNWTASINDTSNWPRCVQIAWQLHDDKGKIIKKKNYLIKPNGYNISSDAEKVHGISTELAMIEGISMNKMLVKLDKVLKKSRYIVGHSLDFILKVIGCEFLRLDFKNDLHLKTPIDTCTGLTVELMKLPGGIGGKYKFPKLSELHFFLFGKSINDKNNSKTDVKIIAKCFFELIDRNEIPNLKLASNTECSENLIEQNDINIEFDSTYFELWPEDKIVVEIFKRNPILFRNLISNYYPFTDDLIEKYNHQLNWTFLSRNSNLCWTDKLMNKYKESWKYLSSRSFLPWSVEFINSSIELWNWKELSINKAIPFTNEMIEKFKEHWHWSGLCENESLHWSHELIELYQDRLCWQTLSKREDLEFTIEIIEKYKDKWNYKYLSNKRSLPWSEELIEKYPWNWQLLSQNEGLPWSDSFFEKYIDKWDFIYLSSNESLNWTDELIEKYWTKWSWCSLSSNQSLPWSIELLQRYKKWDWSSLSKNESLPWSIELIENHKFYWNWIYLSKNKKLPWSEFFFHKFKDKLNFETLSSNIGLPWSEELILLINNDYKWRQLNWNNLSENSSLPLNEEFIKVFKDELVWFKLCNYQVLPYSLKFICRYSEGLSANIAIWKILKQYINDEFIDSIFSDANWEKAQTKWKPKTYEPNLNIPNF